MAAITSASHPFPSNRRRRVRHKIQTPAYATFAAESKGSMLDLHEIVDISEEGVAIQCHSPLELRKRVNLCLDLADCAENIYTTGQVVWSNPSGRAGLHFSELTPASLSRLREWLFINVMAGVANGEAEIGALQKDTSNVQTIGTTTVATGAFARPGEQSSAGKSEAAAPLLRPNYTDTLAAVTAVQRQVEAHGSDLSAALQLIAERAQTLVRASGAAIALAEADPDFMTCRASSGPDAPPIGARLQVGSGFSGECVKAGQPLRCDDTELDDRVDRESCRALGLRSLLAAPIRVDTNSIGIVEVFSSAPNTFSDSDTEVLERLAESVLAAVNRAADAEDLPQLGAAPVSTPFTPMPGSVLFASAEKHDQDKLESTEEKLSGISLPRSHLYLMIGAAILIATILGFYSAPLIQAKLQQRHASSMQTVLASSSAPALENPSPATPSAPSVATASPDELRQMADHNDAAAENALGLRYFQGDEKSGIVRDEKQAFEWFRRAADHGSLPAQAKLGALYWGGRGVPVDVSQAYFWAVLARARGDKASKDLAPLWASRLTPTQCTAIEQQADSWLQQHLPNWKPSAAH
ncbi:MAG TPA: GAF domain-containing protein [Candidatus Sulfotelmatobacter sp.]|jgi:hypothetical protein